MRAVWRTDIGLVRRSNQDSLLIGDEIHPVYAVADGMGGHRGGDIASTMAVDGLKLCLAGQAPSPEGIRRCFEQITGSIYARQQHDSALSGMGTTLTMLWEAEDFVYLGHVGDSRAYLLRGGTFTQQSTDHSLVGELVKSGVLDEQEARVYPYRNVVTRAVGTEQHIRCDTAIIDKQPGDRWLLCSDGLTEHVTGDEIRRMMGMPDMEQGADALVQAALAAGGQDNITLILLEVTA
ncbi:MAG: Stp1/IreP family PP2C-type Ser/Thr phosphatase [Clostridiales bacterium]|nr:Stp1/IreP family PP2C-type Ser/Thr phosphatase [Clostridiales bacterium]